MHFGPSFFFAGAIVMSVQSAWAGKLPKDAVELTADEVKAIYSDTTGVYDVSDEYYAPDGTTKGVFGTARWRCRTPHFPCELKPLPVGRA